MRNLFDYLKFYKDVSFETMAFNDIDALIFSLLSYVEFEGIAPSGKREFIYLEEACYKFLLKFSEKDFKKKDWLFPNSYKLVKVLKTSKRYYHSKLYYFVSNVEDDGQFGALTIRLPNKITFVSFEGTDSTVSGLKEDFELMYQFPIYSQEKAAAYFNQTLTIFDRNIYVGGHSKGGNLAMYAYMYGKKMYKKQVRQVYNFDGPGFLDDVLSSSVYQDLRKKLTMVVPKDSVIGMILGHKEYLVVNSSAYAVLQHDGFTWECFGGNFVTTSLSRKSKRLEENLREYLNGMSLEEKKSFVETVFAIFSKSNITNIMQLKDLKITTLLMLMKELTSIPTNTKRNLVALLRMLITGMN